MTHSVTAIIVNYNGGSMNVVCIESLLAAGVAEIVLVDNASTDGSIKQLSQYASQVQIVCSDKNLGFGRACNLGATYATNDLLLFFNNDAVADPKMLRAFANVMESDVSIGIAGATVTDWDRRSIVQSSAMTIDSFGFPFDPTTGVALECVTPLGVRDTLFVPGCALMIQRRLFEELDGFDEGMFMFAEDADLCWRARLLGFRVVTAPLAICHHRGGATAVGGYGSKQYSTSSFRIMHREANTVRMMLGNLPAWDLVWYLMLGIPLLLIEALSAFAIGKSAIARAYADAFYVIIQNLPSTVRKRSKVQSSRRVNHRDITSLFTHGYGKLRSFKAFGIPTVSR